MLDPQEIKNFNDEWQGKDKSYTSEILACAYDFSLGSCTIAASFSAEDVLLLAFANELAAKNKEMHWNSFVLDTGRLHESTYEMIDRCRIAFPFIQFQIYFPNTEETQNLTNQKGMFSFYESLENRKECCAVRKTHPLKNALQNKKMWVTGIRKEQSPTRQDMAMMENDNANNLLKINPLLLWTWEEVLAETKKRKLPLHPLHLKGYTSIGCDPCTRAIQEGEEFRAGRWWWEDQSQKECGLHLTKS